MSKIILPFFILLFATASEAQYVNITDTLFRNFLMTKYPTCFNASKQMDTTCNKIVNETSMDCSNKSISNLDGIQYFDSLGTLICNGNNLTIISKLPQNLLTFTSSGNYNLSSLPALPNKLKKLVCAFSKLSTLPLLPNTLQIIYLNHSQLTSLPTILPSNLSSLDMNSTAISTLPPLPNTLLSLDCGRSGVSILPTLPINLVSLVCHYTGVTSLPVLPITLKNLDIDNCNISVNTINLPPNLTDFSCLNCNFSSLPTLPSTLQALYVSGNNLTNLPSPLPSSLKALDCSDNKIIALPSLPKYINWVYCFNNNISSFPEVPLDNISQILCYGNPNLHCLPKLPTEWSFLLVIDSSIKCLPNTSPYMSVNYYYGGSYHQVNPPICNATNNPNQCEAFPTVIGKMFYDNNNSNGIKDINEPYKVFGSVALSSGDYSFTDANGFYAITAPDTGSYTIQFAAPTYYNAVPAVAVLNFHRYDSTIVLPDIALQPNTVVDSLQIFATPLNWAARPGFPFPYFVGYANVGTTNLSPTVLFRHDSINLTYDSCNNPLATNTGSSLSATIPNFVAGSLGSFIGYFTVKPTATLGNTIKATASITSPTTSAVYDAAYNIITGSFDPNDKDATPSLTPMQVLQGKPINYTIRFQNTGNDTAFTVVLADTLSSLLQTNTLQVVSSSHPCKVSVKNGVAYFEFKNILLPYETINEIKSHGFVRFTVKPKTTLTLGTNIYNKAYIYFDYNAPIITNTVVTVVKNTVLPVRFTKYEVRSIKYDNVGTLGIEHTWTTASEINTAYFNIQRSVDGKEFVTVVKVKAKGNGTYNFTDAHPNKYSQLTTIYYRLEIMDKDGSKAFSTIQQITLKPQTPNSVSIYPNPATTIVNIDCKDAKQILITDYFFRTIQQFNYPTEHQTLNTKQFGKGIYLVKVITNRGEVKTEKLIVE